MSVQADLFDGVKPRAARRVLMHVYDAGYSDGREGFVGECVMFECGACGHRTGWLPMRTMSEEKRGRPCPRCNEEK